MARTTIDRLIINSPYDGRSLYPRQVFFPLAGEGEGWAKLARHLKAEIDEERIEAYRGPDRFPLRRASTSASRSRLWMIAASRA